MPTMFDFILLIKLIPRTFSIKRDSLHYPTGKRMLAVLILLPLGLLLILVNWLFLILDEIFFPHYRRIKIDRSVFIVGVPRSATTFMLELLTIDRKNITSFRLWEILLAPSIIQKYFWSAIIFLDRKIGRPLYRLSLIFDKIVFNKMWKIHPLSLSKPEEDEYLFLYSFSSVILYYFYPEIKALDPYMRFDKGLSESKKQKLMAFYKQCVQRHNYVFNPKGKKYFLSKNPAFTPKIASIYTTFQGCKIIYMIRSPLEAIPATISMNNHAFRLYAKVPEGGVLVKKTTDLLLEWYEMARDAFDKIPVEQKLSVPFREFVRDPKTMLKQTYRLLNLPWTAESEKRIIDLLNKKGNHKSEHLYDSFIGMNDKQINSATEKLFTIKVMTRI
jgi:hypothetical protein